MDAVARQQSEFIPFGVAVGVVILWAVVSYIVSFAGGWWKLAQRYRSERPLPAHRRAMQKGQMRFGSRYKSVLTLASDSEGIYLGVMYLFRPGHPPLFVPWTEVEVEAPKRSLFTTTQVLRLGRDRIPLKLRESLVDFLLAGKADPGPGLSAG